MGQRGFTLIELSIVLTIIALTVGSVLVGRDIAEGFKIRSTIGQIEKYKTAVTTFRLKYGGLPGDLDSAAASTLGMAERSGDSGHGDGDLVIEDCDDQDSFFAFGCEDALFWNDLAVGGLIPGDYSADIDDFLPVNPGQSATYLPDAAIGNGNVVAVFSVHSTGGLTAIATKNCQSPSFCFTLQYLDFNSTSVYRPRPRISTVQAAALDSKIDDGLPLSGQVRGSSVFNSILWSAYGIALPGILPDAAPPLLFPGASNCLTASSGQTIYDIRLGQADVMSCVMQFAGH